MNVYETFGNKMSNYLPEISRATHFVYENFLSNKRNYKIFTRTSYKNGKIIVIQKVLIQ